jgi:dephospho-CoA kinase
MIRIALSGKMGAGKTSIAEILKAKYELDYEGKAATYAFADKLKEIAVDVYEMKGKDRRLLQILGENMRHVEDDAGNVRTNVWTDYLIRKMDEDAKQWPSMLQIVHDLRFKHEYESLKKEGFYFIRVDADEELRQSRLGVTDEDMGKTKTHLSEIDLDGAKWDLIIENTGSYEELHKTASIILEDVLDDQVEDEKENAE